MTPLTAAARWNTPGLISPRVKDRVLHWYTSVPCPRVPPRIVMIGAQKAGTTTLHNYVCRYGEGCVSSIVKETHLLQRDWSADGSTRRRFERAFPLSINPDRQRGVEASTSSLSSAAAPGNTRSLGGVTVVAILRDPLDRLLSQYRHATGLGIETRSLEDALVMDAAPHSATRGVRFGPPDGFECDYVGNSRYRTHLARWSEAFDPTRILLVDFNALGNVDQLLPRLLTALGVPMRRRRTRVGRVFNASARDDPSLRKRIPGSVLEELGPHLAFTESVFPPGNDRPVITLAEIDGAAR